ncbi:MAG: EAL domain-containing protein, partial [Acidimicrobiales bacterium]
ADAAIVASVIGLAHALGLTVVAEGVETTAQAATLVALGCDRAQGFLFARPQPASALEPLLRVGTVGPMGDAFDGRPQPAVQAGA